MFSIFKWLTSGTYRRQERRRKFYSQLLSGSDLFFDVGANMGNRITSALEIGARVVAVEPQKDCLRTLENTFGDSIEIVPKALGEKEQTKTMYISNTNTLSTLSQDWVAASENSGRFGDARWDRSAEVEVTTLDSLINEFGQPRFVKIDVEGYELEVLQGLSTPVPTVSIEYAVPDNLEKTKACLARLGDLDPQYRCNFSVGEGMKWSSRRWRTIAEMDRFVSTREFVATDFGDIYVSSDPTLVS